MFNYNTCYMKEKANKELSNQDLSSKCNKLSISSRFEDQTRPDQTRPDQTRPDQTRPDQTRPDQTRPDQTRPDQTTRPDCTRLTRSDRLPDSPRLQWSITSTDTDWITLDIGGCWPNRTNNVITGRLRKYLKYGWPHNSVCGGLLTSR